MRSSCSRSRNHLLYLAGKGAQAMVCNQIIMLQSVFNAIPTVSELIDLFCLCCSCNIWNKKGEFRCGSDVYCLESQENWEYFDHECAEGVSEDTFFPVCVPIDLQWVTLKLSRDFYYVIPARNEEITPRLNQFKKGRILWKNRG